MEQQEVSSSLALRSTLSPTNEQEKSSYIPVQRLESAKGNY